MKRPTLVIYNTESRQKEEYEEIAGRAVHIYTCGPTVYNYAHIGNFRTYLFEDILRRTFKFFGYPVIQAMNITDVDDKTIQGAIEKKIPLQQYTQGYKNAFFVDLKQLNIEKAEYYPLATDYIDQMIDLIQKLIDKGVAYQSEDKSVYYLISSCKRYGRLSHLKQEELQAGAGEPANALDEYDKENVSDFVLWKAYDSERDGQIFWESPWGRGRPGWHIECSAMAMSLLGETVDIHVGGVDNIFPHHENEIAQSESCTGKLFARYWMHAEHLLVDHKKMSKSLGNFYTLRDLLEKGYSGREIRFALLQAHYRTQLNFTFEGLSAARSSLHRLDEFLQRMLERADQEGPRSAEAKGLLEKADRMFKAALADDLNIPQALGALFDLLHGVYLLRDQSRLLEGDAYLVVLFLEEANQVLAILDFEEAERAPPEEMLALLTERNRARNEKNWAAADRLRAEITSRGYQIEDTPDGSRLRKKSD